MWINFLPFRMAPTILPQYEYYYNTELLPSGNQNLSQNFYQPNFAGIPTDNFIQEDYINPENLTDNFDDINSFSSPETSLFLDEGDQGLRLDYLQNVDFDYIPVDKGYGEQSQEYRNEVVKEYPREIVREYLSEAVVERNKVDQIIQEVVQNSSPELKEPKKRTAMVNLLFYINMTSELSSTVVESSKSHVKIIHEEFKHVMFWFFFRQLIAKYVDCF